jgi:hypothetical protein
MKYPDAEPLLLTGCEGIKKHKDKIPLEGRFRLKEALDRLLQLYDTTGKRDEAMKWRKKLDTCNEAAKKPKP